MKKFLAYILLIIVTACTFIPCCQVDNCCADQLTSAAAEHNEHKEEGTCSPLFSCATCPASVELAKPIQLPQPIAYKQIHQHRILIFNLSAYSVSFWQPPRFC